MRAGVLLLRLLLRLHDSTHLRGSASRWHGLRQRGWQGVPGRVAAPHYGVARPLHRRRPCASAPLLLLLLLLLLRDCVHLRGSVVVLLLALTLLLLLLLLLLTLLLLPQRAGLAVAAVHSSRIVVRIVTTGHVCASRCQAARNRARCIACRCRMPRIAWPPLTSVVTTLRPLRSC